jgi:hypothetical protein
MDLFVIPPLAITDAILTDASMAEDSTAAWSAGATYDGPPTPGTLGDRVHSVATHTVYECRVDGTVGVDPDLAANQYDPTDNPTGAWIVVGATNRWKPFDGKISDLSSDTADLVWNITPTSMVTAIAILNVRAASVRISIAGGLIGSGTVITADTIIGAGGTILYDEERALVDNSGVVDWWTYLYSPVAYETEVVFQTVPAFAGSTIVIEVKAPAGVERSVGEIVLGYEREVARVLIGGSTGITDFSTKDYDTFGNPIIVERVFADTATYPLIMTATEVRGTKRLLASLRARPAVYHVGEGKEDYGLMVYGFPRDMPFALESGPHVYLNLEVEGLT